MITNTDPVVLILPVKAELVTFTSVVVFPMNPPQSVAQTPVVSLMFALDTTTLVKLMGDPLPSSMASPQKMPTLVLLGLPVASVKFKFV